MIALLLAPTVPSDPNPQNLHAFVPAGVASISSVTSNEVLVTSSTIPIVKPFFGSSLVRLAYTAAMWDGFGSFDPNPNLPPTICGAFAFPENADTTSKYKGSPIDPGSLVLSNTAIFLTVDGIAFNNLSIENGL